jgi:hypothetical protein
MVLFKTQNVAGTGFCLCLELEPAQPGAQTLRGLDSLCLELEPAQPGAQTLRGLDSVSALSWNLHNLVRNKQRKLEYRRLIHQHNFFIYLFITCLFTIYSTQYE